MSAKFGFYARHRIDIQLGPWIHRSNIQNLVHHQCYIFYTSRTFVVVLRWKWFYWRMKRYTNRIILLFLVFRVFIIIIDKTDAGLNGLYIYIAVFKKWVWLNTAKDHKGPQRTHKGPQKTTKDRKGALHRTTEDRQSWENCQTCNNFV